MLAILLVALQNLLLFSWFDRERDEENQFTSMAVKFGDRTISRVLVALFGFVMLTGIITITSTTTLIESTVMLVIMGISLTLAAIQRWKELF